MEEASDGRANLNDTSECVMIRSYVNYFITI